jgi:TPR repeat protein
LTGAYLGIALLLALTLALGAGGVGESIAAEEPACAEGKEGIPCRANAGDPVAMYVMGRNAYEIARTSGDFTEAMYWSRQLVAKGDKNGERLQKMVYLQLGWGMHRDYVQAYVWLSEGIAAGADYVLPLRKKLMEKMTPEQLAKARELAGS